MRSPEPVDKLRFMATPAMPVVTALYGGLNALFNIYLANRVSTARRCSCRASCTIDPPRRRHLSRHLCGGGAGLGWVRPHARRVGQLNT